MLGTIHFVLACACLAFGAVALLQKKGGRKHRWPGYLYCASLLLANLSALSVYEDSSTAGPFHILAWISLATLSAGFIPAFLRRPAYGWMNLHAYFMSWSYVGLVAAGVGQLLTEYSTLSGTFAVGLPSLVIVAAGGLMIHSRLPETLTSLASRSIQPQETI
ncbi:MULTISPECIES: DUF2306 domain-containing protein [unclassified Microbulbifer]|uniref:DUF2306 domain-containing protein n=1 Tax=unclassified Microbulbifer TaxID=2619833 RepID=UPI001E2FA626|nr:DUF2306 domain-containing protein [Microbulbifer sp. YPW16]UHQ54389.1 DUF2306 domain-containing protein [Microbulbifer sp. YPW16]